MHWGGGSINNTVGVMRIALRGCQLIICATVGPEIASARFSLFHCKRQLPRHVLPPMLWSQKHKGSFIIQSIGHGCMATHS